MVNHDELARFLRSRRARLRPPDVGLPAAPGRRVPGLRRQEVAQLASMSIDYYIRLEQGRGPHPSRQVLAALARALMLTADERTYLFRLADAAPPPAPGPTREVPAAILALLETLTDTPAYVMDARYDILAWNPLATHFIGDLAAVPARDRNVIRWAFTSPRSPLGGNDRDPDAEPEPDPDSLAFARASVADLRAAVARYPDDRDMHELVTELLATSPRFAAMWDEHEVASRRNITKVVDHPVAGRIEATCQILHIPDTDQRLVLYVVAPGTVHHDALRRLQALGEAGTATCAGVHVGKASDLTST